MQFVQAQFSLKYEPQNRIRRSVNEIEDYLQEHYGTPQTIPVPDEFNPEVPRIVLYSKNGHSQISFSQISVDFTVRFDNDYLSDFSKTKKYINERLILVLEVLKKIGISEYLYCGLTYNSHIDIDTRSPIEYMKNYLGGSVPDEGLYEASQNVAIVIDDYYFVNKTIGTYKEFKGIQGTIPILFDIQSMSIVSEGVSLALDVNNRYHYIYSREKKTVDSCFAEIEKFFSLIDESISEWK